MGGALDRDLQGMADLVQRSLQALKGSLGPSARVFFRAGFWCVVNYLAFF